MKKISFSDRLGQTNAVLEGFKTMTRRVNAWGFTDGKPDITKSEYKVGDIVAISQSYLDIHNEKRLGKFNLSIYEGLKEYGPKSRGWTNKCLVKPDAMPHRIKITDVRLERLQDISEEDCIKEGIIQSGVLFFTPYNLYNPISDARTAFEMLMEELEKGIWQRNPYVYVYSFELLQ